MSGTNYSVEEEVSAYLRRNILALEGIAQDHRDADSPPRVQSRLWEVVAELERITYNYEEKNGIEFDLKEEA